mgnify:CR=1 FL=1
MEENLQKEFVQVLSKFLRQQPVMQLLYLCSELFTKSVDLSNQLVNHGAILTDTELEYHYLRVNYQQLSTSILITVSFDFPYYSNPNIDLTTIFASKEFAKNLSKFCWDSRGEFDQIFRNFTKEVLRAYEFPENLLQKYLQKFSGNILKIIAILGK